MTELTSYQMYQKKYREDHREENKQYQKEYRFHNHKRLLERKKVYDVENRLRVNKRNRTRYAADEKYRIHTLKKTKEWGQSRCKKK